MAIIELASNYKHEIGPCRPWGQSPHCPLARTARRRCPPCPGQPRPVPAAGDKVGAGPGQRRRGESVDAPEVRVARGAGAGWAAAGLAASAEGWREWETEEGGARQSGGGCAGESVCARARVRAPGACPRPRAPSPRPSPPPCSSLPSSPRPALPPNPRNQCSCCRAGCGFLQSLPLPPLRPERARSPAQQRPPVPSCEPRPQPRTAPRSRLPAHPPGRGGAGGGRDPGAPTPLSAGGR